NSLLISYVLIHRFGLASVGLFALGLVAMAVVGLTGSLGLSAYLPRLKQPHAQSCTAALSLQLLVAPLWIGGVLGFAILVAHTRDERAVITLVGVSGILMALANTGLMLSIMKHRFAPGLLSPLCETAAVVLGGVLSRTPLEYAAALLIGRIGSAVAVWWGLQLASIAPGRVFGIAKSSVPYMLPDTLAMLSEQVIPLTLASVVTRSELGVYRLCQQLLTAADTPGWSYVQARYPDLVGAPLHQRSAITRQVTLLGAAAAALCLGGSALLAYFVFRVPAVAPMMAVLALTLVWRYRNNLFDQAFRASGWVGSTTVLGAGKLVAGLLLAWPLTRAFHVWGGVACLAILSVGSGLAYQQVYARRARLVAPAP
nr:hypothetical protein [Gemmatimonadales bacterium]